MLLLTLIFLAGSVSGMLVEYVYHWYMHKRPLMFHIDHHKEFFFLPPRLVAIMAKSLRSDFVQALLVFAVLCPFKFLFGWLPVLVYYGGLIVHLVVYEVSHATIHYDAWLPALVRELRFYKWWRGCHLAHHFHAPRRNFCVTNPLIDKIFGTYVPPKDSYPELPHPRLKPKGLDISIHDHDPS